MLHLLLVFIVLASICTPSSAQVNEGSALYRQGENATAVLLNGKAEVPASRFPCAGCHGEDGMGGKEGATFIPPISWQHLGRTTAARPAYTLQSFRRAVTEGVSATGQSLGELMPRYKIDQQLLIELVHYLKLLDRSQRMGITTQSIHILPPEPRAQRSGFLEAIARFNSEGGSYGRTVSTESVENYLLSAADIASVVDKRVGIELGKHVVKSVADDGINVAALYGGMPDSASGHSVAMAGVRHDANAPTLIVTERQSIDIRSIGRWIDKAGRSDIDAVDDAATHLRMYAPLSAVALHLEFLLTQIDEMVLFDLDESAIRWALATKQSADAAAGYVIGSLLAEVLLNAGRDPTRYAVMQQINKIDLQKRIFTWRSAVNDTE